MAGSAQAVNLLTNPGFELPELGTEPMAIAAPTGWSWTSPDWTRHINADYEVDTGRSVVAKDGHQVIELIPEWNTNGIRQVTSVVAEAAQTYIFTVYALQPSYSSWDNTQFQLQIDWAGGGISSDNFVLPTDDHNWLPYSLILDTAVTTGAVGKTLNVELTAFLGGRDVFFDGMVLVISAPEVTITESGGSTDVGEDGPTSDTYIVHLDSEPSANVTVTVDPDIQTEVNGKGADNPVDLTFTASDWDSAQTVTVTAIDDEDDEGTHSSTITHTVASGDFDYNGISVGNVVANVSDNEVVNLLTNPGFELPELGTDWDWTNKLTYAAPDDWEWTNVNWVRHINANYEVETSRYVAAKDGHQVIMLVTWYVTNGIRQATSVVAEANRTYTFTAYALQPLWSNWGNTRFQLQIDWAGGEISSEIFVLPTDDHYWLPYSLTLDTAVTTGAVGKTLNVELTSLQGGSEAFFDGMVLDTDKPCVVISETGVSTALAEPGISDTYIIRLNTQPTADVTITVDPDSETEVNDSDAGNPVDLTFTTSNWNMAQTVTVVPIDDLVAEGDHTSTITHTAASSGDLDYNGISIANVVASVADPSPILTDQPDSVFISAGMDTNFYVGAIHPYLGYSGELTYKWYKQVSGGSDTLEHTAINDGNWTVSNVQSSDTGTYYCVVEVTDEYSSYCDTETSDYFRLDEVKQSMINLYDNSGVPALLSDQRQPGYDPAGDPHDIYAGQFRATFSCRAQEGNYILAYVYQEPKSSYYRDPSVLNAVLLSLDHLCRAQGNNGGYNENDWDGGWCGVTLPNGGNATRSRGRSPVAGFTMHSAARCIVILQNESAFVSALDVYIDNDGNGTKDVKRRDAYKYLIDNNINGGTMTGAIDVLRFGDCKGHAPNQDLGSLAAVQACNEAYEFLNNGTPFLTQAALNTHRDLVLTGRGWFTSKYMLLEGGHGGYGYDGNYGIVSLHMLGVYAKNANDSVVADFISNFMDGYQYFFVLDDGWLKGAYHEYRTTRRSAHYGLPIYVSGLCQDYHPAFELMFNKALAAYNPSLLRPTHFPFQLEGVKVADLLLNWSDPVDSSYVLPCNDTATFTYTDTEANLEVVKTGADPTTVTWKAFNYDGGTKTYTYEGPPNTNIAPTADAGPCQKVYLTSGTVDFQLNGGGSFDDGLTEPLTYQWDVTASPEGSVVVFDPVSENTVSPKVTMTMLGVYQFRLEVDDGEKQDTDEVTITVSLVNDAPTADAGSDQQGWLTAGNAEFQLDGSGSFDVDGIPDPLTYQWSVVESPGGSVVVFDPVSSDAVDTRVTMTMPGIYELQLEVDDGNKQDTDSITITVYEDSCTYAQAQPGFVRSSGDMVFDCLVDLDDLLYLATRWLGDLGNVFDELYTGTRDDFSGRLGFTFRAETDFAIDALGRAVNPDFNSGVLQTSHVIELFEVSSGTLLASATIDGSSEKDSLGYAFESLSTPVDITSGQEYMILSEEAAGSGDPWKTLFSATNYVSNVISILGSEFSYVSSGNSMPASGKHYGADALYVPPTFSATVTSSSNFNVFDELYTGTRDDFSGRLGFTFRAETDFAINALGRAVNPDFNSGVLQTSHVIELFEVSSGALLASAAIDASSEKDSLGYAFESLTVPVEITSGTEYMILSQETAASGDPWRTLFYASNYASDIISILGSEFSYASSGNSMPASGKYFGADALYVPPAFSATDLPGSVDSFYDLADFAAIAATWMTCYHPECP